MSDTYSSSSYYYSSATSTTSGTQTTGHRFTTTSHTDPEGNTVVRTAHQDLGEPAIIEEHRYDRTGRELLLGTAASGFGTATTAGGTRRIEDLGDRPTRASMYDPGTAYGGVYDSATGSTATGYDTGQVGTTAYNPSTTGAYEEHSDYDVDGTRRHHREKMDEEGRWYHRDVDRDDGRTRVHREHEDPNTGERHHSDRDY